MKLIDSSNYPVYAFPVIARDAALEIHKNMGSPIPLIMTSLLGTMSLAFQDKVDVRRMNGLVSPCSLFVISIAESGERKTATDKPLIKPFRDFEERQAVAMKPEFNKYRAEKSAWEEEKKGIQLAIRINAKNGEPTDELKTTLIELESKEPIEPKTPKMIYMDTTAGALQIGIEKQWRSVGIMADEGGIIFDSQAMKNLTIYNKFWDGDPLIVDRIARECLNIKNGRLTISIAVQPKTLDKFLKTQGRLSRDNGFLARFLIAYPHSTQGSRFIDNPNPSWQYVTIFQNRIAEILNGTKSDADQNSAARITLNFSPEAQAKWIDFYNRVERDLSSGGYLFDVKDAGAKIADNVARVAGLFHCMEGCQGDISLDTVTRAAAVCEWHLHEFKRLFGMQPELPIEISDANELETWLVKLCHRYPGWTEIGKNVIAQLGPNQLRGSKIRRDAAVYVLAKNNKLQIVQRGKTKNLVLNPACFPIPHTPYPVQYQKSKLPPGR
jgi:putative DNA primase/helicase